MRLKLYSEIDYIVLPFSFVASFYPDPRQFTVLINPVPITKVLSDYRFSAEKIIQNIDSPLENHTIDDA